MIQDLGIKCFREYLKMRIFKEENRQTMETNKEIISRLKFIGKLQKGDKINTRHMYIQPVGYVTTFSRTFLKPDNRGNALTFVQDTINRSFDILEKLEKSDKDADKTMCSNIVKDLERAIKGLKHLKNTYLDDVKFCCDMDTHIQVITSKLYELGDRYPLTPNKDDELMSTE